MRRSLLKKAAALTSALMLVLGVVGPVMAADMGQTGGDSALGGDSTTKISLVANGGLLTQNAPVDVDLGSIITSTTNQIVPGTASDYTVDEARGYNTTDEPGWSAVATFTDMTSDKGTIDVTNFTVTPQNLREYRNSQQVNVGSEDATLGSAVTLADSDDDGTSDSFTWLSAAKGHGIDRFKADLGLSLVVPANTPAGDYSSTVTITVS